VSVMDVLMLADKPLPAVRPTGIGVAAYNMALALSRHHARVHFVCRGSFNRSSIINPSLKINEIEHFSRDNFLVSASLLSGTNFNVVHVHSSSAFPSLALARVLGKKVVTHCHADEPFHPIRATMMRNAGMNLSARVIAVSNSTKRDLIRTHRSLSSKIVVAYNGVNLGDWECGVDNATVLRKYDLNPTDKIILSIGTIQRRKGQLLVVECLPKVLATHSNVTYVNIGPTGEPTYRDRLLHRAETLGISQSVKLVEDVPQVDLASIAHASSICVHPSEKEAFGLAVVEEMACGKAVVAFGVGGIPEIIESGTNGLVTKPGDLNELSESILRLLDNESFLERLGAAAREKVSEKFTWDKTAERLEEIYADLL